MTPAREPEDMDSLLGEQVAYYRAVAPEYEDHGLDVPGGDELDAALTEFGPRGDVLELACGPGTWTARLAADAETLTSVDASREMLSIAASRVPAAHVRFVHADIFEWRPDRRYDVVFFAFWLSHVPPERFDSFWSLVGECLRPDGRVFFADDGYRTSDELAYGESSSIIRRTLKDGTGFRIVKVPLEAAELEARLARLGWRITVHSTAGPFFWGAGRPA